MMENSFEQKSGFENNCNIYLNNNYLKQYKLLLTIAINS